MKYQLLVFFLRLFSALPLKVLYVLSDWLCFLVRDVVKYRRSVVHDNLVGSFPEKTEKEIADIEKDFYRFLTDYAVETIKLLTMSRAEISRRMTFEGVDTMVDTLKNEQKHFAFIYLAHYGNWEWVASMAERIHEVDSTVCAAQIYHPLRNKMFDRLFLHIRSRFGGDNVKMKETLRYILRGKAEGKNIIMGFIADQAPSWESTHHWITFLNRMTPVYTGTEQIGKKVDAVLFYGHLTRPRRGYYHFAISRMPHPEAGASDYPMTDIYFSLLEKTICQTPHLWLWSHKRWKRTYEKYLERQGKH